MLKNGNGRLIAILTLAFSVTIAIIFIDILTPSGITDGALYVIPVLLVLPYGRRYTRLFAAFGTALIIVGYYLSPSIFDVPMWYPIVNRTLSFIATWAAAIFGTQWNDIILQARLMSDNLDARNVRLLDAADRIRSFKKTNVYKAASHIDRKLLLDVEDIIGNQATLTYGLKQLDELRASLLKDAEESK